MWLREYVPRELELEQQDLYYLTGFVQGADDDEPKVIQSLTPTLSGTWRVQPGPYVGRLGLPSGRSLDLLPRFDFEDVLHLISLSGRAPNVLRDVAAEAGVDLLLPDLIALAYLRELERLAAQGLAKDYRGVLLTMPPYAGRPDILHHLGTMAARPDRLAMRARRMTTDIELNRALAVALEILLRVHLDPSVARRLQRLRPVFARIRPAPTTSDQIRQLQLTRLTARYEDALGLAALIVSSQEIAFQSLGAPGASILFSMPKVWEGYVEKWVAGEWPGYRVEAQHRFALSTDGSLESTADVVVFDGQRSVALYDAKYKFSDRAPVHGDVYQMVTYCERLGLHEATLVYPLETPARSVTVSDKVIHVRGVTPPSTGSHRSLESMGPLPSRSHN